MRTSLRLGGGAGFAGDRLDAPVDLADTARSTIWCSSASPSARSRSRSCGGGATRRGLRRAARCAHRVAAAGARATRHAPRQQLRRRQSAGRRRGDRRNRAAPAHSGRRSPRSPETTSSTRSTSMRRRSRAGWPLSRLRPVVSANAYLGADALLPALASGADIVITGRVADPSLFVAPLMHEYGWAPDDVDRLARGTAVGHLLECAGQLCGGYFADPGRKDVPAWRASAFRSRTWTRTATRRSARSTAPADASRVATATEQLLYEVTDPHGYLTPDVTADFSAVTLAETAPDRVAVRGARGRARPDQLKVSVGYLAGYVGEGEIGYAGTNAVARARARRRDHARAARRALRRAAHRPHRQHVAARPRVRPRRASLRGAAARGRARRHRARRPRSSATRSKRSTPTVPRAAAARASTSPSRSASCRRCSTARACARARRLLEWGDRMPKLYDLAHCRAGDKGNTSILSLIAYRADDYPLLAERVTVDAVARHLAGIVQRRDSPLRIAAALRAAVRLRARARPAASRRRSRSTRTASRCRSRCSRWRSDCKARSCFFPAGRIRRPASRGRSRASSASRRSASTTASGTCRARLRPSFLESMRGCTSRGAHGSATTISRSACSGRVVGHGADA